MLIANHYKKKKMNNSKRILQLARDVNKDFTLYTPERDNNSPTIPNNAKKYYAYDEHYDTCPLYIISRANKWTTVIYHNIDHIFTYPELYYIIDNDKQYLYFISMDGYTDGMIDIETGCYTRLAFEGPDDINNFHMELEKKKKKEKNNKKNIKI